MQQKSREQENHLAEITRLLSLYQALTLAQLEKLYPELSEEKLAALLRRLEKADGSFLNRKRECFTALRSVPGIRLSLPLSGCFWISFLN